MTVAFERAMPRKYASRSLPRSIGARTAAGKKQGDAVGVPKENILSSAAAGKDKDGDNYDPNAIIIVKKVAETVIHKRSIPPPKRQII